MRALAWVLAVFYMANGAAMVAAPAWWFAATPGVSGTGPFNFHFVVDVGIAFALSGLMIAWGAMGAGWRLILVGAAFPSGHALFHIIELMGGHSHGPVLIDLFGVVVPAGLALGAAWTMWTPEAGR